jgi:hypothetical protein
MLDVYGLKHLTYRIFYPMGIDDKRAELFGHLLVSSYSTVGDFI